MQRAHKIGVRSGRGGSRHVLPGRWSSAVLAFDRLTSHDVRVSSRSLFKGLRPLSMAGPPSLLNPALLVGQALRALTAHSCPAREAR